MLSWRSRRHFSCDRTTRTYTSLVAARLRKRSDTMKPPNITVKPFGWIPPRPDGYYNLAKVLSAHGKQEEAIAAWEQVRQREPDLIEPHFRMSMGRQELCCGRITMFASKRSGPRWFGAAPNAAKPCMEQRSAVWCIGMMPASKDDAREFEHDPKASVALFPARRIRQGAGYGWLM